MNKTNEQTYYIVYSKSVRSKVKFSMNLSYECEQQMDINH